MSIMAKNRPNIYIADKRVKFCRDVRFGLFVKKKYGHTWNSNLDACWCQKDGAEGRGGRGGESCVVSIWQLYVRFNVIYGWHELIKHFMVIKNLWAWIIKAFRGQAMPDPCNRISFSVGSKQNMIHGQPITGIYVYIYICVMCIHIFKQVPLNDRWQERFTIFWDIRSLNFNLTSSLLIFRITKESPRLMHLFGELSNTTLFIIMPVIRNT